MGLKLNERVMKCSWVKFKRAEVKCSEVKVLVTGYLLLL